ncbi:conserved hypothetical protein [Perkinsus marinus ATCC 50983]|uniref:Uncharacterized protein n=1 Tax=Perkinsus marinus (strain ATCC 50983 / TXsc) TaxID=423536 RepID=C5KCP2_PERM5|nr:conserved hypothetical protein [Perkinsus marinus ATCC 50983]EER17641.1 conserved hypothetical protein [Perkinsus marinus ATCC 50983]|eukprot:XP_002785845.1 conserved hypothetical protein [Perkinsus marinus ATCC 50983]
MTSKVHDENTIPKTILNLQAVNSPTSISNLHCINSSIEGMKTTIAGTIPSLHPINADPTLLTEPPFSSIPSAVTRMTSEAHDGNTIPSTALDLHTVSSSTPIPNLHCSNSPLEAMETTILGTIPSLHTINADPTLLTEAPISSIPSAVTRMTSEAHDGNTIPSTALDLHTVSSPTLIPNLHCSNSPLEAMETTILGTIPSLHPINADPTLLTEAPISSIPSAVTRMTSEAHDGNTIPSTALDLHTVSSPTLIPNLHCSNSPLEAMATTILGTIPSLHPINADPTLLTEAPISSIPSALTRMISEVAFI